MKRGRKAFEKEKELLFTSFPDWIIDMEHIGSTAVDRLPAKPIIDMIAAIRNFDSVKPLS